MTVLDNVASTWERNIIGFAGKRQKVLVVDDKWSNRSILVSLLEPLGFEVMEATDGLDGLNKAQEFKPDCILLDLVMPVMDGFEATRRIRTLPELKEVVLIAVSASVFNFNQQQSREVGCDDFLPKPVRETELLEKLQVYLGLEWVYEEETNATGASSEQERESSQETIVAPPAQEIAALFDLAMRGDIKGIVDRAAQLEALDRQWVPFAIHLRQLAKDFEDEKILEFIKQYRIGRDK
jgi:CheY-like chemotaxis protein